MDHVIGVRNPDLYELCEQLKEKGADDNFIGRLYVAAVINAKKYGVAGADDASKQDQLKQNFQRSIRSRFGETIFSINQGNSIDKLIKGLSRRSQVIAVGSNPEGVENVLYQIASAKKFGRIGLAVFEGARNFTERIPRGMRGFEYRLELEYDLIKRELESKND